MRSKTLPLVVMPVLSVLAIVLFFLYAQDRLPEQVATHWGPGGEADGFTSAADLPWLFGGIAAVVGALMAVLASLVTTPSVLSMRFLRGMPTGIIWFIGGLGVATAVAQFDGRDASSFPGWAIGLGVVCAAAGWLLGSWVAGRPEPAPATTAPAPHDAARHPLGEAETALWSGQTPNAGAFAVIAGFTSLLAIGLSFVVGPWVLVIFVPVIALVLGSSRYRVSLGPAGLRVAGRLFSFPRLHVPLAQIASVEPGEVRASQFGGWGIRQGIGGETAVITKSGPALVLTRTDGAVLRVSLDAPEEPAAVLSTLLDRR